MYLHNRSQSKDRIGTEIYHEQYTISCSLSVWKKLIACTYLPSFTIHTPTNHIKSLATTKKHTNTHTNMLKTIIEVQHFIIAIRSADLIATHPHYYRLATIITTNRTAPHKKERVHNIVACISKFIMYYSLYSCK